jgi:hypothetical protein
MSTRFAKGPCTGHRVLFASAALATIAGAHCTADVAPVASSTESATSTSSGPIHPIASSAPCLGVVAQSNANGAGVEVRSCDGGADQQWSSDGASLRVFGSKCLDVTNGNAANGTKLQIWDCGAGDANPNQKWTRAGLTFTWSSHGKCLDLTDGVAASGTLTQSWACFAGDANQQWSFGSAATDAGATADAGGAGTVGATDAGGGATSGFVHPGILDDKAQLDFVKAKIAAGAEPWKSAFEAASGSNYGSLSYVASPVANVECGPYSNPDVGCSAEKDDATAAYTHALLWYFTGNAAHAQTAIGIMNAWSSTVKEHTNSNAPLQSAWVAEVFPRAAEIIRYTGAGWSASDAAAFETMLKNVYLPEVVDGSSSNGNWELSMSEATMNIGVFLDDAATFQKGVALWRGRVPAYVYMTTDGATPVQPPKETLSASSLASFWYGQTTLVDGVAQETCRDLGHVQYGLAAMINAAETARIQGVDLYSEQAARIAAALEFHAQFLDGAAVPSWLCGGSLNAVSPDAMWEIGFNEYAGRLGMSLPNTQELVGKIRPTWADHHMDWETLTHAEIGSL